MRREDRPESFERLIRILATRKGKEVELRVHYGKENSRSCDLYRIFSAEEVG